MQNWTDTIKFLNEIGLLPLILLLLAIPGGMLLFILGLKRLTFKSFSVRQAWESWLADQKARTAIETKLEERLTDLTEQLKQIVSASWDSRRYFDEVLVRTKEEHTVIINYLQSLLILAKKRKSDWTREPEPEMLIEKRS